jgi:GAF domain-containing protein/nitrogen-specific signal transduction histidine kinase
MATTIDDRVAELERANAELRRQLDARTAELTEAHEQHAAASEILGAISRSPTDLQPVFEAIVASAARLCSAEFTAVARFDDGLLHLVAINNMSPEETAAFHSLFPRLPTRSFAMGRAFLDGRWAQFADVLAEPDYDARTREVLQAVARYRTFLGVPILRERRPIGVIGCARRAVEPFTETQIGLLEMFAEQAAIALENVRLLYELETRNREVGEALEQQTATAEVLQVINSSPGDLAPVFDAMLDKAMRLCDAAHGHLYTFDGERVHPVAMRGEAGFVGWFRRLGPYRPSPVERTMRGERVVHVADALQEEAYRIAPGFRELIDVSGIRTGLTVALRKEDAFIGAINVYRKEVRPFSDKQIALLQNFAAQAVIAIENARLITETREALEQQTATAEVLQVINSSPGALRPVFDAMLDKAMRLCQAVCGHLYTYDGERFSPAAVRGERGFAAWWEQHGAVRPRPGAGPLGRIAQGERVVVTDYLEDPAYRAIPQFKALVDAGGLRSAVAVALRKDEALLGSIHIYRQEVRPFSDKQIALLQNFAAQAVIAMENARLLTETREALEYQTATSDVLRVISGSAFDLAPVLETAVATAVRLCRADQAVIYRNFDGEYRWAAGYSLAPEYERIEREITIRPGTGSVVGRAALECRTVQILDAWTDPLYEAKADARVGDIHTLLGVPLLRDGVPVGVIGLARRRVEAFASKEIELVRTFADQAVIAIENARLLGELRHRTEELGQQQAVLRVTFDNMADGVVRFDEGLRLAAWNRNFVEVLDLPDRFLAEPRTYADLVRYMAGRGEYGAVDPETERRRLIENADRQWTAERTRPDGRVLEVRHNPVPGGGFVLIYSDITERKRAETEIRAARDAAETALRELQTAQASLVHAQKMAALGQLTAGVAHEIENPLNFVNNFAGLSIELLDELKEAAAPALASLSGDARSELDEIVETLTGNLKRIAEHGRRADGIVKSMLDHSRTGSGERQRVDINALVEEALNLAYHGARAQDQNFNIVLDRDLERDIGQVEAMPQDLMRVFLNLFGNGFYAADKRRREMADAAFRPVLKVATRDLGGEVEIRVCDNGTGIAPEFRDKLFQPFFTTKPTGEGTGLGLSISYDIVTQQHGGTITVDSIFGEFTEFTIRLPHRAPTGVGLPVGTDGVSGRVA